MSANFDAGAAEVTKPPLTARLKRPGLLLAIAAAIGALLVAGYWSIGPATAPASQRTEVDAAEYLKVDVIRAQLTDHFTRRIDFVGRVEAARESNLSFERMGLVTEVLVEEGDLVDANQVLARLDTAKLDTQRKVLVARLDAANALLAELVAGPRAEDLKAQRAEVKRMGFDLQRIELSLDRNKALLKNAATSREQYEADLFAAEAARSALEAATAELEELENGTRAERLDAQRAVVKQIEAEVASVDVDLRKSDLRTPFAGSVGNRLVDEGAVVAMGNPIVTVLEVSRPELRVGLDPATAAELAIGDQIAVKLNGRSLSGAIKAIRSDVSGRTRTVDVLIQLPDVAGEFLSGRLATAQIRKTVAEPGVWLPVTALTEGTRGLWSVFVAAESAQHHVIERRDVEVLHTETNRVFVRGALGNGEWVVASGIHRIVPKLRVSINPSPAP
jgi:multidrug efflux pump subunit AcrA (membrane-fusion protein)